MLMPLTIIRVLITVIFLSLEPCSAMLRPQERSLSSKWSVSASSSVCQKQLHIQLSERLQQVLKERNKDSPPPEASDIRRDSNETNAEDQYVSSLCTSKPQHAQSNGRAKRKSKGQTSLETSAVLQTSTTKTLKEKKTLKSETESKRAQLDKEKVWLLWSLCSLMSSPKFLLRIKVFFFVSLVFLFLEISALRETQRLQAAWWSSSLAAIRIMANLKKNTLLKSSLRTGFLLLSTGMNI